MIEIIPVSKRAPDQIDTDKCFFIEDSKELDSIAKKYNWAIENIILKSSDNVICFRHADTQIRMQYDKVEKQVLMAQEKGAGVCGVIGTIMLEQSCVWWTPNRDVNGSGAIIQGGKRPVKDKDDKPVMDEAGKPVMENYEFPMNDHPGTHDYLATVDGCCLWVSRKLFEDGIRFDTELKGYHFYDADICCQALEHGYKVSTIAVPVFHMSSGIMPKNFDEMRKVFFEKWNKKVDGWPISRLTKFK